jgi:hypothetical protein
LIYFETSIELFIIPLFLGPFNIVVLNLKKIEDKCYGGDDEFDIVIGVSTWALFIQLLLGLSG